VEQSSNQARYRNAFDHGMKMIEASTHVLEFVLSTLVVQHISHCVRRRPIAQTSSSKDAAVLLSMRRTLVIAPTTYWSRPDTKGQTGGQKQKNIFRIGELNPGLVGTDQLSMIESDKS